MIDSPACPQIHHGIMQSDHIADKTPPLIEWVCTICGRRLYGPDAQEPHAADPLDAPRTSGAYSRWENNTSSVMSARKGSTRNRRAPS